MNNRINKHTRAPRIVSVLLATFLTIGATSCSASGDVVPDISTTTTSTSDPIATSDEADLLQIILKPIETDEAKEYGDQEFKTTDGSFIGKVFCGGSDGESSKITIAELDGISIPGGQTFTNKSSTACDDKYLSNVEAAVLVADFISETKGN